MNKEVEEVNIMTPHEYGLRHQSLTLQRKSWQERGRLIRDKKNMREVPQYWLTTLIEVRLPLLQNRDSP